MPEQQQVDVVVVGAGFGGLYTIHKLRGLGLSVRAFEAGKDVGGTWYWNRYPGARCDVESVDYSYSFDRELEQEWNWTERYASQPEILAYLGHVADRYDLRRDITFGTRVSSAHFDEDTRRWTVTTDGGEELSARYCVMAAGCLSTPNTPPIPGVDTYAGNVYHTGQWPHEGVDFTGQRVGVIGTGSSAIQAIPIIADQAAELVVFQRTPNFSVPARNKQLDEDYWRDYKSRYPEYREENRAGFLGAPFSLNEKTAAQLTAEEQRDALQSRWDKGGIGLMGAFADNLFDRSANDVTADFVREQIRQLVDDPETAEALAPRNYAIGSKRVCVDTDYFATYNRDNVRLVNLKKTPIGAITPTGISTTDEDFTFDSIIYATGFDAISGALLNIDISGRAGRSLQKDWEAGPKAYLGVAPAGFPNMFIITGPGSPSVLSNMVLSIEQHVEWVADCIEHADSQGLTTVEATDAAQEQWMRQVDEIANMTVIPTGPSWYVGANIEGKPHSFPIFLGGVGVYREICRGIAANAYEGFTLA